MAIKVVIQFLDKATVRIIAYFYNDAGNLTNPTGTIPAKIDLFDPAGTQKLTLATMTNSATGTYYYLYNKGDPATAMDAGQWRGTCWAYDGTGADEVRSPGTFSFTVEET